MTSVRHSEMADSTIIEAVGRELLRVRNSRGWTRRAVADKTPGLSVQALANYEHGIRPCTVARFVQICKALGASATDVLGLALQRAETELQSGVQVDLYAVVRDRRAELRPLRRWARNRLADDPDGSGVARIDRAILKEMAALLGFSKADLTRYLISFTPESAPVR